MSNLISWLIALCFAVGFSAKLLELNKWMAEKAVHAHQHQMSYSKFTQKLVGAEPRGQGGQK